MEPYCYVLASYDAGMGLTTIKHMFVKSFDPADHILSFH